MKRAAIVIFLAAFFLHAHSQEQDTTTLWNLSGQASINFSQVSFTNWVAGGQNSVSGVGILNLNANYEKDRLHWENTLKSGYGLLKEQEEKIDYINNLNREELVEIAQKYFNQNQRTRGYILPENKGGAQQ